MQSQSTHARLDIINTLSVRAYIVSRPFYFAMISQRFRMRTFLQALQLIIRGRQPGSRLKKVKGVWRSGIEV